MGTFNCLDSVKETPVLGLGSAFAALKSMLCRSLCPFSLPCQRLAA